MAGRLNAYGKAFPVGMPFTLAFASVPGGIRRQYWIPGSIRMGSFVSHFSVLVCGMVRS